MEDARLIINHVMQMGIYKILNLTFITDISFL